MCIEVLVTEEKPYKKKSTKIPYFSDYSKKNSSWHFAALNPIRLGCERGSELISHPVITERLSGPNTPGS